MQASAIELAHIAERSRKCQEIELALIAEPQPILLKTPAVCAAPLSPVTANAITGIFFPFPLQFFPVCYDIFHFLGDIFCYKLANMCYKLCNMYYKLSNMRYKVCNKKYLSR